jgi:hypothetical protein
MEQKSIQFLLSIWGAGLSTLLGILTIVKFRKDNKIKINCISTINEPHDNIRINVCNIRSKPVTIIGYSIGIGGIESEQVEILKVNIENERKLDESDIWTVTIQKSEIIPSFLEKKAPHNYFQVLWANIFISSGEVIRNTIYIDPKIINFDYFKKAEQFIATDIFLERESLEIKILPLWNK